MERAPLKTTILYIGPSMSLHVKFGESFVFFILVLGPSGEWQASEFGGVSCLAAGGCPSSSMPVALKCHRLRAAVNRMMVKRRKRKRSELLLRHGLIQICGRSIILPRPCSRYFGSIVCSIEFHLQKG